MDTIRAKVFEEIEKSRRVNVAQLPDRTFKNSRANKKVDLSEFINVFHSANIVANSVGFLRLLEKLRQVFEFLLFSLRQSRRL